MEPAAAGGVFAAVLGWLVRHGRPGDPVIVACSGGTDSLALAAATLDVVTDTPQRRRLVAATVDHGLQTGSAERAAATADQLSHLGYHQVEVSTVAVGGPGGMEAAARRARYRALLELSARVAGPTGPTCPVLLAHTADDQAETVLLGLARGSGPRSIAGMREWRAPWGRPLLGVTRATTEATCRTAGLVPWHDPHNADPAFTRSRLRHEVLPLLDDVLGGGVRAALVRTAELMAQDLQALDEIAASVLPQVVQADGSLDVKALAEHPAAVVGRVLRTWAAVGGAGPLTFRQLGRMKDQVLQRSGPPQVRVPGGLDVIRTGDELRLVPVTPAGPSGSALLPAPDPLTPAPDPPTPAPDPLTLADPHQPAE